MFINARLTCFFLICLFCTAGASAQQSSPSTQAGSGKIYLDVVVSPKSGAPVSGLQQRDFTLLDNKVPQSITSFKAVTGRDAPIEVVLVIDAVNTTFQNVSYERVEIDKFLRADGGHLAYPISLAVFADKGVQIVGNFSSDGNALSTALQQDNVGLRDIGRSAGFNGATERLQLSLQALRQVVTSLAPRPGRKVILWLSPGWPLLSGPNVSNEIDSKQQQQLFSDIVGFSTQLLQARVTLYSIDPLGDAQSVTNSTYYMQFLKGISKSSQVNVGNLGLPVLAVQSGGLALNFSNDIAGLLHECLAETAPYYEISFDPAPAGKPDEYHHMEIQLANHGLTARTRQGYYAQPLPRN
jgi:VWFA-related protein